MYSDALSRVLLLHYSLLFFQAVLFFPLARFIHTTGFLYCLINYSYVTFVSDLGCIFKVLE